MLPLIMENQMEKKMENEMETGINPPTLGGVLDGCRRRRG